MQEVIFLRLITSIALVITTLNYLIIFFVCLLSSNRKAIIKIIHILSKFNKKMWFFLDNSCLCFFSTSTSAFPKHKVIFNYLFVTKLSYVSAELRKVNPNRQLLVVFSSLNVKREKALPEFHDKTVNIDSCS